VKLFFPLLIVGLMAAASVPYLLAGDWGHGVCWLAAAIINVVVTV
jgi:hypothetical protein